MITQAQIDAENITPALTANQVLILTMLVRRYPQYSGNVGLYPAIADKFTAEISAATVKTAALKAVLTQLGAIPAFVVESSGSSQSQSFFSTKENWAELAQDVLDIFYEIPIQPGPQHYGFTQRKNENLVQKDRAVHERLEIKRHNQRRTGWNW